jgi:hypothetical protein
MVDLLLATTNPGLRLMRWTHHGVEFERERHSFTSARHGLTVEIITLSCPGRRGWSLMVTKEYWWTGAEGKPFKSTRWARPLSGQRAYLMAWLRAQEKLLEQSSLLTHNARAAVQGQLVERSEEEHNETTD